MADHTIKQLEAELEYHHKALRSCPPNFVYKPNIESSKTEIHAQIGHYYYKKDELQEAIRAYQRTRATDPDHFQALHQLCWCYRRLEQFKEARLVYDEIIERVTAPWDFEHKIDAYLGKGWSHLEEGKEINLTKASKYPELIRARVLKYPGLDDFETQLELQQKAHQTKIDALLQTAKTQLNNKNWREADTTLKALKQLSPNHEEGKILQQALRDAISTKAFMDFTKTLFNGNQPVLVTNLPTEGMADAQGYAI